MKEIKLTQGKVALVDNWHYDWLNQWKWFAIKVNKIFYAGRQPSRKEGARKIIFMHRFIMSPPDNVMIDHRNGNGLDNQEHNLREASNQQNQFNSRKRKSKSAYRGVYYANNVGKKHPWVVKMKINGKKTHVGCYSTEVEAAKIYDKMAEKHYGEFAVLNFNPKK